MKTELCALGYLRNKTFETHYVELLQDPNLRTILDTPLSSIDKEATDNLNFSRQRNHYLT